MGAGDDGRADGGDAPTSGTSGVPPIPRPAPYPTFEGTETTTPLAEFLEDAHARSVLTFALEDDAPPLDGPGDRGHAYGTALGTGATGTVYLVVDRDLRRSVAMKVLNRRLAAKPLYLKAFVEEAIITGGLEHPNIPPIHAMGFDPERGPYFTMKRLAGAPLSAIIKAVASGHPKAARAYPLHKRLTMFAEVCRAVAYAHDRGVLHCDLKPANVMVGMWGEVLVVDWGLAKVMGPQGATQARAEMRSGTPAYMPPEQVTGTAADLTPRSDIWSLGVILYELLALVKPFQGETQTEVLDAVLEADPEPPGRRAPERHIPEAVARIALRALRKDPDERFESVGELLEALEEHLEGEREQRRREEETREALGRYRGALEDVASIEAQVDALQRQVQSASGDETGTRARLDALRRPLLAGYQRAMTAALDALDAGGALGAADEAAGGLYWRVFARIYPGRVAPGGDLATDAVAMLTTLGGRALKAVVQAARHVGDGEVAARAATRAEGGDPWLDAVLSVRGEGGEADAIEPMVRKIAFLKAVPLFAGLGASELLPIVEACETRAWGPGEVVFRQNDVGDAMYVIADGVVEVIRDGNVLTQLFPGDCFGEIAVLDEARRSAAIRTVGRVECLTLTAVRFRRIVIEHGEIGLAVIRILSRRMREATERESDARGRS